MSLSLRKFRALLYNYVDAGTEGSPNSTYELVTSGASDDSWWASLTRPSGLETTTGMKADHRIDAVIGFSAAVPVTEDGAIVINDVEYLVRAILPREYGRDEVQVEAERATESLVRFSYTTMALGGGAATVAATAPEGGLDPTDATRTVTRTGTGSVVLAGPVAVIAYTGAPGQAWLSAVRSGADPAYTFTLSFDVTGLVAAVYTATVTITDAAAPHSTITLTVILTIT